MNDIRITKEAESVGIGTVCAQCGYRFMRNDSILRVHYTGDMIHKACFIDYVDDNVDELCDEFEA